MDEWRRYLIEDVMPLKDLSAEARREKAIRYGHISTLHVWWARRPLVVARAAVLGVLLPAATNEADRARLRKFVVDVCRWETNDKNLDGRYLLNEARALIHQTHLFGRPKILDSMAGGGSIPLEALRLGCDAYALEYNPVAYIILKATLEYPGKYGARLLEDVQRWGEWVLEHARQELTRFYPTEKGRTVIAYLWARTVGCIHCKAEIPLFRQFWLARKARRKVALKPLVRDGWLEFEVVEGQALDFDPSMGTVRRATANCLICGAAASSDYLRTEAQAGRMGHRLVAVVTTTGRGEGRQYTVAPPHQAEAFQKASEYLERLKRAEPPWSPLPLLPDEPVQTKNHSVDRLPMYGASRWGDAFNSRQALALVTFGKWVREAHREIARETGEPDYARAVATYLAMAVDFVANRGLSILCSWFIGRGSERMRSVFSGHHLHMIWDYAEANPLSSATGWSTSIGWIRAAIQTAIIGAGNGERGSTSVSIGTAAALPFQDGIFDAAIVDPPYYDNVDYADLSDFFYVWLRRVIGDLYPEAFGTSLAPKDEEIVHNPARWGGGKKGEEVSRRHFERLLTQAFRELHRVVKPDGAVVVMFTHRSTEAWERLIRSFLEAGLYPTASFPVHTEMEASTHQRGKGAIQSTILMACRKQVAEADGWYHEVREQLRERLHDRLDSFWEAGIRGADFFISAIGPAVEVFGQYTRVLRPDGTPVEVGQLLDEVRALVADYALERMGEGLGQMDETTRFYVLYRWAYGNEELDFDEVNKLSKALGVELDYLIQTGLAWKKGGKTRLYTAVERWGDGTGARILTRRIAGEGQDQMRLIDIVHGALSLWRIGDTQGVQELLTTSGQIESEPFWRTAQALFHVEDDWLSQQSPRQEQPDEEDEADAGEGITRGTLSGIPGLREEHKLLQQFLKSPATLKSSVAAQLGLELEP